MKIWTTLLMAGILLLGTGCEKVIDIELNDSDTRLVIAGKIFQGAGNNEVRLSLSNPFYEDNSFTYVENASVSILTSEGETYELSHSDVGIYSNDELAGMSGVSYTLRIVYDGKTYEAVSVMPSEVELSELVPEYQEPSIFNPEGGYLIRCKFDDPAAEKNYYRMVVNTPPGGAQNNEITVTNDQFNNGLTFEFPLFQYEFNSGNTVDVTMWHMDESSFHYFESLAEIVSGQNANSAAPGNPPSMITGGALGYFGAYYQSNQKITLP